MNARTANLVLMIIGVQGTMALLGALWLLANKIEVPTVIWINSSTTIAGLLGLFQHKQADKTDIGNDATINVNSENTTEVVKSEKEKAW